jgi:hypothetical protein
VILLPKADASANFDNNYADELITFLDQHCFKLDKKSGSLFDASNRFDRASGKRKDS